MEVETRLAFRINPDEIVTLENGYKYWWPTGFTGGCFGSHTLRKLADALDELNRGWDNEVQSYLGKV